MTTWVATDSNPAPFHLWVGFARNAGDESWLSSSHTNRAGNGFYNLPRSKRSKIGEIPQQVPCVRSLLTACQWVATLPVDRH